MIISDRRVLHSSHTAFIERLNKRNTSYYLRRGTECVEVVVDEINFFFKTDNKFPIKFLYLFPLVRKEARAWLADKQQVVLPQEYPSVKYNLDFKKRGGKIIGFDLDHAYWRIARNFGIISEGTYLKALDSSAKALRLAALSTMGRSKTFEHYKGSTVVEDKRFTIEKDQMLIDTYKLIRMSCFEYMNEAAEMLGNDFDCWKTDCIYFLDTPENRDKMHKLFTGKGLTYKLLEY